MRILLFYCVLHAAFSFGQNQTKLVDSLLQETKKDTSYVQLTNITLARFSKEKIDSINAISVQGVSISQDSVKRLLEATIASAKSIGYQKGVADAYLKLGINYFYLGNYKASYQSKLEAIKIYETTGDLASAANVYGELGYSSRRRDLNMANTLMQQAIKLAKSDSLKAKIHDIFNNYSVLKLMEKQYDSAKYYAKKGLLVKVVLKDTFGIPYSYSNLANVYVEEGRFNQAHSYFNKALSLRKNMKDSIGMGESYVQIAEAYNQQNKLNKALENYKKSMFYAQKKKYGALLSYNYYQVSNIYKKTKKVDSALHYLERHLKLKDSIEGEAVLKELAELRVQFDTEKKEKKILTQRVDIAEKELALSQKNTFIIGLVVLAAILGILGYLFYSQQKLKNKQLQKENELKDALLVIETQNRLQEQRLQISRDLHDNIGAQLTFIISSLDNLKYGFKLPENLGGKLKRISEFTTTTIHELRDTIWAMNKNEISFEDLQVRIVNFIDNAKLSSETTQFNFKVADNIEQSVIFSSVQGMNVYRIIQEAINNAIKYAHPKLIEVSIHQELDNLVVEIKDNGRGFNSDEVELGNGLNNMKKRALDIGADLVIDSKLGEGTIVKFQMLKNT